MSKKVVVYYKDGIEEYTYKEINEGVGGTILIVGKEKNILIPKENIVKIEIYHNNEA